MAPSFLLAVVGYVVVGALLEKYDETHNSNAFWVYTAIIWLAYATAHNAELTTGLRQLVTAAQAAAAAPAK